MGGSGSGRYMPFSGKITVEACLSLDVNKLVRDGMIRTTPWQGSLVWRITSTGEERASAGYTCTNDGAGWVFTVTYMVARRDGEKHEVKLPIRLQTTLPNFGGVRWWFACPLSVGGRPCERRVGKLYIPPGGLYFGCRHCYDLTYTSCQESHRYDRLWRTIAAETGSTPEFVKRIMSRER